MNFCAIAAVVLCLTAGTWAQPFHCAVPTQPAGKVADVHGVQAVSGSMSAAVIFAGFADGSTRQSAPAWSASLFDPDRPGSLTHFYDTMSFGAFRLTGSTLPRRYISTDAGALYATSDGVSNGDYGRFVLDILRQADVDTDFSQFDSDDDGVVDVVFVNVDERPLGFFRGGATGIAGLGFSEVFVTNDVDSQGNPVRIDPSRGTAQRARQSEAVGVMAHEFGHILGLPDLFDVAFLSRTGVGPADDSAGIGNWGIMGWGADGWHGDDGPTSFCAWSRLRLGWVQLQEARQTLEHIALPSVGESGDVYRIPVTRGQYFLLENRPRNATYYDRNIPGDGGLLIWHIGADPSGRLVDLESADGRWSDAGYPAGTQADAAAGGDNLDFWSRDASYTAAHMGNQGDATDAFDGVRFDSFTPDTNPAGFSIDGHRSVRVDSIRLIDGIAFARVRNAPPGLRVHHARVQDDTRDGILAAGESAIVNFGLSNVGGLAALDVVARLSSDDPALIVTNPEARFGRVDVGSYSGTPTGGLPSVRLADDFEGSQEFTLMLEFFVDSTSVLRHPITLDVASSFRLTVNIRDSRGDPIRVGGAFLYNSTTQSNLPPLLQQEPGLFTRDLEPGQYFLSLSIPQAPGLSRSFTLRRNLTLNIDLPDMFRVTGLVTDSLGVPMSQVNIRASNIGGAGTAFTTTNADGQFNLNLPVGRYTLTGDVPFEAPVEIRNLRAEREILVEGASDVALQMRRGIVVETQLRQPDGAVLNANVPVLFESPFGFRHDFISSSGRTIISTPGLFRLRAFAIPPPWILPPAPTYQINSDTLIALSLTQGFRVSGLVGTIEPQIRAFVSFVSLENLAPTTVVTDSVGRYEATLRGRYQVSWNPGSGPIPGRILSTIDVDKDMTFDIAAEPGPASEGRLLDIDSDVQVPSLSVLSADRQSIRAQATVRFDGSYELQVPRGSYLFFASTDSASWSLGHHRVEPPVAPSLSFSIGRWASGRVLQADGLPRSNGSVRFVESVLQMIRLNDDASQFSSSAGLREDGTFRVPIPLDMSGFLISGDAVIPVSSGRMDVTDLLLRAPPTTSSAFVLHGNILVPEDVPYSSTQLLFYDEPAGIIKQVFTGSRDYFAGLPAGRYRVRAAAGGVSGFSAAADLGTITVTGDQRWDIDLTAVTTATTDLRATLPDQPRLDPAYPNPFNSDVMLSFVTARDATVELTIYNALGQVVRRLVDDELPAGTHQLRWDATDDAGRSLATGVYLIRLQTRGASLHERIVLLR